MWGQILLTLNIAYHAVYLSWSNGLDSLRLVKVTIQVHMHITGEHSGSAKSLFQLLSMAASAAFHMEITTKHHDILSMQG
jgi:hypothetical protein